MSAAEQPRRETGNTFSCLVVDDDGAFANLAAQVVREEGGAPKIAGSIADAQQASAENPFDVVLLDNHLPDGKGYGFFDQLARRNPEAPIVMITGVPDLNEAINLTRNGLFDYLTKPVAIDALAACLQRVKLRLQSRSSASVTSEFFGDSPAMHEVFQEIQRAAKHGTSTVLFTGETGVGKDLAARMLHQLAFEGRNAPFIAVNCAALPGEMFESELFGAERGAYTGAERKRSGLAGAASGGTLFLDEIAEVPLALQGKLLRLLEAREFRALGSVETQTFSGRFVAATNKSLETEVAAGRFRDDLRYRLDVFAIELPPLRQRRADIPGLAELLLSQLADRYGRKKPMLKTEDISRLSAHDFPGNVRELRNILERSLLRTDEDNKWLLLDLNRSKRSEVAPVQNATPAQAGPSVPPPANETHVPERELSPIESQEYRLVREAMRETNGGIRRAATKLGLSPQALLRRLEKWPELRGAKE